MSPSKTCTSDVKTLASVGCQCGGGAAEIAAAKAGGAANTNKRNVKIGMLLRGEYRGLAVDDELVVTAIGDDGIVGRDGNHNRFFYEWELVETMKIVDRSDPIFRLYLELINEIEAGEFFDEL